MMDAVLIIGAITWVALENAWRGEDKPFGEREQANRIIYGLAFGAVAVAAGADTLTAALVAVGAFLGMLIPHGQWHRLKHWWDYLFIAAVCAARGALVLVPVIDLSPSLLWASLASGAIGLATLIIGHMASAHYGYQRARSDIIWHAGWAAFTAGLLAVAVTHA